MLRFLLRDMFWVTALVAMGLGWWNDHRAIDAKRAAAVQQTQRHRRELANAKTCDEWLCKLLHDGATSLIWHNGLPTPDWSILDEPLIEP
jgi:hypothetical protein